MNRGLREGEFERPNLTQSQHYLRKDLPGKAAPSSIPGSNILKTLRAKSHAQFIQFIRSLPAFEDVAEKDEEWTVHQFVGGGGFGGVGHWLKKDKNNQVTDELAIKEMNLDQTRVVARWSDSAGDPLLAEAVIQAQLNKASPKNGPENENITHLRNYKYFGTRPSETEELDQCPRGKYRFYLEYAPYETLLSLVTKYRYWNTFLPEAFLWHVFDSLANAAMQMFKPERDGLPVDDQNRHLYEIVHFDMKPANIFLGYPEHRAGTNKSYAGGTREYDYPVIKLGDFGLAEYTGPDDVENPHQHWGSGTDAYHPPEQIHYGAYWPESGCPNGDYRVADALISADDDVNKKTGQRLNGTVEGWATTAAYASLDFKFLSSANVWQIGKIMYECATLAGSTDYWQRCTNNYHEYTKWQHSLINFDKSPFKSRSALTWSPYSKELTDLIQKCTQPRVKTRISLAELCKTAEAGRSWYDRQWQEGCEDAPPPKRRRTVLQQKLFYKNNDIIDMPRGAENIPVTSSHFADLKRYCGGDPDWRPLDVPFDLLSSSNGRAHRDNLLEQDLYIPEKDFVVRDGQIRRVSSLTLEDTTAALAAAFAAGSTNVVDPTAGDPAEIQSDPSLSNQARDPVVASTVTNLDASNSADSGLTNKEIRDRFVRDIAMAEKCTHGLNEVNDATTDASDSELEIVRLRKTRNRATSPSRYQAKKKLARDKLVGAKKRAALKDRNNTKTDAHAEARANNPTRRKRKADQLRAEAAAFEAQLHGPDLQAALRADTLYEHILAQAYDQVAQDGHDHTDAEWEEHLTTELHVRLNQSTESEEIKELAKGTIDNDFPSDARWPKQRALSRTDYGRKRRARLQVEPYRGLAGQRMQGYRILIDRALMHEVPRLPDFTNPQDQDLRFVLDPGMDLRRGHYRTLICGVPHTWNGKDWYRVRDENTKYDGFSLADIGNGELDKHLISQATGQGDGADHDDDDTDDTDDQDSSDRRPGPVIPIAGDGAPDEDDRQRREALTQLRAWDILDGLSPQMLGLDEATSSAVTAAMLYLQAAICEDSINVEITDEGFCKWIRHEADRLSQVYNLADQDLTIASTVRRETLIKAQVYDALAKKFKC